MIFRAFLRFILFATLLIIWAPIGSQALTIDFFQGKADLSSSSVVGDIRTLHVPAPGALGGGRSFSVSKKGTGSGLSRLEVVDNSLGYTQGAHAGVGIVTWDGDTDPTSVKFNGLGGVDLTQDAGTSFRLGLDFFDYPANQPIKIVLRVYDASAADGKKFSEINIELNQYYDGPGAFPLTVPFHLLAVPGDATISAPGGLTFSTTTTISSLGAADMRNVGAITLTFNGASNSKAPDVILSTIGTDGRCQAVPNTSGKVLDECGVCLDTANALKGRDRCGACLFGPPGYSYEANRTMDACNLCSGERYYNFPDGNVDSCGTCINGPAPYKYVDGTKNCDVANANCARVKPTEDIQRFESDLVKRALSLKNRFIADANRSMRKGCGIDLALSDELVGTAFDVIAAKGREVFRRGIWVCGSSCVTVSFAGDVKALMPQFKILERETAKTAKKVQKCYRALGISSGPIKGGPGAARIISDVQEGVASIIRACKRNKVCRKL